jgi:1-deoxy-D-xylulose-5-phosphate reductoisomerase
MVGMTKSMPKTVNILGATGSIGASVLDLIGRYPDQYAVHILAAHSNIDALATLARQHHPVHVVLTGNHGYDQLKAQLADMDCHIHHGMDALLDLLAEDCDLTVNGISGVAGLLPSLKVLEHGGTCAIANKESLVAAGAIVMETCRKYGGTILPTDSEHNAIFQVWSHSHQQAINSITLTASGGPFLHASQHDLDHATADQALRHPNWDMGRKISIDSATMMNKGLEVIEACVLFDLPEDRVKVVIHPQSIIHGLVNYADGSMLAQLGPADMRVPLSYVLAWPDRLPWATDHIDLAAIGQFDFLAVDHDRFPAVKLSRQAWRAGGLAPAILNAANEVAVAAFLDHRIGFTDIVAAIDHALSYAPSASAIHLDDILAIDMETKTRIAAWLEERR